MTPDETSRLHETGAGGIVRGYASLFDVTDLAGDRILPGAFGASIAKRGAAGIRMLWQHDPGRPIGIWTSLAETRTGLLAEGRLALGTEGGREAFALIRAGAVDGLSIGFRTRQARPARGGSSDDRARRLLAEIDLWEISVVTFPMQEHARLLEPPRDSRTAYSNRLAARMMAGAERLAAAHRGDPTRPPRPQKETTCRTSH